DKLKRWKIPNIFSKEFSTSVKFRLVVAYKFIIFAADDKVVIIALLNAGRSFGVLLVIRLRSVTTSWSSHNAPAFFKSTEIAATEVILRFFTASALISTCGPWQIAAISLSSLANSLTKANAALLVRNLSGFITPPGSTSASKSLADASSKSRSTLYSFDQLSPDLDF